MIDDPELRALFRAESEEHLQTLEEGLLRLEAVPNDTTVLENVFRSAHSLKGAARMLGVSDLEALAHHFEDELGAARRGRRVISSDDADRLYRGLDAMRRLAKEAIDGESAKVNVPELLARLRGEAAFVAPTIEIDRSDQLVEDPTVIDLPASAVPAESHPPLAIPVEGAEDSQAASSPSTFKIETIRVEPHRLDSLTTLAGEMAVTTGRAVRALSVIGELVELWEDWDRDALATRAARSKGRPNFAEFDERERGRLDRLGRLLGQLERTGDDEIGRLGRVANDLIEAVRAIRLLPFSTIFSLFGRLIRDLAHEQHKEVRLVIEGGSITADKHLLEEIKDPLMHMIRNAIDHSIALPDERIRRGKPREGTIWLRASRTSNRMVIEVEDDGRGLDEDAIRRAARKKNLVGERELAESSPDQIHQLIFAPGFSSSPLVTDVSGRGVGLDVVRTNIERLKGSVEVESDFGRGCIFRIETPVTLETTRVLLAQVDQRTYAIPIEFVQETNLISPAAVFPLEGRPTIEWQNRPVPVAPLADLLELPPAVVTESSSRYGKAERNPAEADLPIVLLSVGTRKLAVFVDILLDEQEVILKPFDGILRRVRNVLGSTILSTGEICMVLNPHDLIQSMQKRPTVRGIAEPPVVAPHRKLLLLADDSITTRTQEKRILEGAGYEVVTAVDGADAYQKLQTRSFDGVVSDIEMPNMTGLQLAAQIRQHTKYSEMPIILVTSLASEEDRQRGADVGANAYLTKGNFDQRTLLETLRNLV